MKKRIIGTPQFTGEKLRIRVKINKIISNKDVGAENMISIEADMKVPNDTHKTHENTKTKKKKTNLTAIDKSALWEIFDNDKKSLSDSQVDVRADQKMECVYNKELDLCNYCNSSLIIMEDGFPTCTNINCGIINRDVLDYSPEWRFYGNDDKN